MDPEIDSYLAGLALLLRFISKKKSNSFFLAGNFTVDTHPVSPQISKLATVYTRRRPCARLNYDNEKQILKAMEEWAAKPVEWDNERVLSEVLGYDHSEIRQLETEYPE